jgi:hypothetical protein
VCRIDAIQTSFPLRYLDGWRFDDDLRDLPALAAVPIEAYVLAPLDREMLRDVIEGLARLARLRRSATGSDAPGCGDLPTSGKPDKALDEHIRLQEDHRL